MRLNSLNGFLLVLLLLAGWTSSASAQTPTGQIVSISKEIFALNTPTTITVKVRNTGAPGNFKLIPTAAPADWTINQPNNQTLMANNQVVDFVFNVNVGGGRSGNFTFELWGELNFNPNFPVMVQRRNFAVTGKNAPFPFELAQPAVDVELAGNVDFIWSISGEANNYSFFIYRDQDGLPGGSPLVRLENLGENFVRVNVDSLGEGGIFHWRVNAFNEVGFRQSTPVSRRFFTSLPAQLGPFDTTSPVQNQVMPFLPTVTWSPSMNATSYTVELYNEEGGMPSATPARVISGITTLNYTFTNPPLVPGFYYVAVFARRGLQERVSNAGLVRFQTSQLKAFNLLSPLGINPPTDRVPTFRWEATQDSGSISFYRLKIWRLGVTQPEFEIISVAASYNLANLPGELAVGTTYEWHVEAVNALESRPNEGGRQRIRTSSLAPIVLISPEEEETGVPTAPLFRWQPNPDATLYNVWVAPDLGGAPNLDAVVRSGPIEASEWQYTPGVLSIDRKYWWRVIATDGVNFVESAGGFRSFHSYPFVPFDLLLPINNTQNVPFQPTLTWESAPNAEWYEVFIEISGHVLLAPIRVEGDARLDFAGRGLHLNGSTLHKWHVVAHGQGATIRSTSTREFRTNRRRVMDGSDVIDTLLLKQIPSDDERVALGVLPSSGSVIDAAALQRWELAN